MIVSLTNMQLEPPPSKLVASVHPSVSLILATFSVVIPATHAVTPSPSHTHKKNHFLIIGEIPIAERGSVPPWHQYLSKISSSYVFFMFSINKYEGTTIPVFAYSKTEVHRLKNFVRSDFTKLRGSEYLINKLLQNAKWTVDLIFLNCSCTPYWPHRRNLKGRFTIVGCSLLFNPVAFL